MLHEGKISFTDGGGGGDKYRFGPENRPLSIVRNLLMYVNICGVPFLFLAHLLLFKFYSSYDLWTSNGVHLVYFQVIGKMYIIYFKVHLGYILVQQNPSKLYNQLLM